MSTGIAAVQARIAQIQGQFAAPAVTASPTSPATAAPAPTFSSTLQTQQAALSTPDAGAAPTTAVGGTVPLPAGGSNVGERVVAAARAHLGTPYVWGGESPGGFDCSGLVQWSYKQAGIDLPRVSRDQAKAGHPVSPADARPGDLVFFERGSVDHIGLYAGQGKWIVAPKTGDVVKVQDVDLSRATTIRRIVPDTAAAAVGTATAAAGTAGAGTPYAALFASAGARHGVSPALLTAVARAESGFRADARSPAGAQGLMQLMPATARGLGVDPSKPAEAVDGAARLLKSHLQRFGSTELALAAYNAGPGAVTKHGGVPPYRETQQYVAKIMAELRRTAA